MSLSFGHLMLYQFQSLDLVFHVPEIQNNSGYLIFFCCRRRKVFFFYSFPFPFYNPSDRRLSAHPRQCCSDLIAIMRWHTHIATWQTGATAEKQRERRRCRTVFAQMEHLDRAKHSSEDKGERKESGVWNKRLIRGRGGNKCYTHTHVQHDRVCLITATQRTRSALCCHPHLPLKSHAFVIQTQAQLSFLNQICSVFFPLASILPFVILLSLFSPSSVN